MVKKVRGLHLSFTVNRSRRITIERLMHPVAILVLPEIRKFAFLAHGVPNVNVLRVFTTNGSDESCSEEMR